MSRVIIRSVSLSDPVRAGGVESRYLRARLRAIRRSYENTRGDACR